MTSRTLFYNLMREDLKKKSWIIVVALITFIFINPFSWSCFTSSSFRMCRNFDS